MVVNKLNSEYTQLRALLLTTMPYCFFIYYENSQLWYYQAPHKESSNWLLNFKHVTAMPSLSPIQKKKKKKNKHEWNFFPDHHLKSFSKSYKTNCIIYFYLTCLHPFHLSFLKYYCLWLHLFTASNSATCYY